MSRFTIAALSACLLVLSGGLPGSVRSAVPDTPEAQAAKMRADHAHIKLVHEDDPTNFVSPPAGTTIVLDSVALPSANPQDLFNVLRESGILPSGDAFALIYQANPSLKDLSTNQPLRGATLILPRLEAPGASLAPLLAKGLVAEIDLFPVERQALTQALDRWQVAFHSFDSLPNGNVVAQVRRNVDQINTTFEILRGKPDVGVVGALVNNNLPVLPTQFAFATNQVELATTVLTRINQLGVHPIKPAAVTALAGLAKDSQLTLDSFYNAKMGSGVPHPPPPSCVSPIKIHVTQNNVDVPDCIIYCVYQRWYDYDKSYAIKHSTTPYSGKAPVTLSLNWCLYTFWGSKRDVKKGLTQKMENVFVSPNGTKEITLFLPDSSRK